MTREEAGLMKSRNMDCDSSSHVLTKSQSDEKIDNNRAPEKLEHLSSAVEYQASSSTKNLDDHTQEKKIKAREKRKRCKANQRRKKELSRSLSSLGDGVSPSMLGMQDNSAKNSSLEPSDQAPAFAHTEDLTREVVKHLNVAEDCSATSSIKGLEGHAQVHSNSEAKEMKSLKKKKRVKKKNKLSSDPSSLNDSTLLDIKGTSAPVEVLDQVPTSSYAELMEEMVSVSDPSLVIKENDSHQVNESASGDKKKIETETLEKSIEEHDVRNEAPFDISEKCSGQFNKDTLDTGCGTLKWKKRVKKKTKLSSNPSSLNETIFANTEELMEEVISVNNAATSSTKGLEGHAQVDSNSEANEMKSLKKNKRVKKKNKLSSDPSSLNDNTLLDIKGISAPVEVLDQIPTSAYAELMEEMVSVNVPPLVIKENDSHQVNESASGDKKKIETETLDKGIEEHDVRNEAPFDISEKCSGQFNKDTLDTGCSTLKWKKRVKKKKKLSSDPSSLNETIFTNTEELMEEVISVNNAATSSTKGLEGHAQVYSNSEANEMKSLKKNKRVKKKNKLSSNPSSLNDNTLLDIKGISTPVEVLDQVPTSAYAELMEEMVSVNDPPLVIKENDSHQVNESASGDKKKIETETLHKGIEEHDVWNEAPFDISEKCPGQFNKDTLDTGCSTLKWKKRVKKKTKLSSNPSSLNETIFANTEELMEEVISVNNASTSSTKGEGHAQVNSNSEAKEMKSLKKKKRVKKKNKLSSDPSSLNDNTLLDIKGTPAPVEVLDQVPTSAYAELMEEMVSVNDRPLVIKENDSHQVNESASGYNKKIETEILEKSIEEHDVQNEAPFDISEKGSGQFTKDTLETGCGTLKWKKRVKKKTRLSSDPSSLNETIFANTEELMEEVISVNNAALLPKENDSNSVIESASGDNKEIEAEILEKSVEEHAFQNEPPFEDMSEKFSGQFNKDTLDTGCGTLKKKKRVGKKRKLSSDPSSLNDGALMDIQGTSANDLTVEVLDQVTMSANAEELMEELVSLNDAALLIEENDSNPVNESATGDNKENEAEILEKSIEEHAVQNETTLEDMSEKFSGQFNKDELDTEYGTLKKKKRVRKKRKLSSDPSSLNDGALMDIQGTSANDSTVEVLDQVTMFANAEEMMEELVSVNDAALLPKENDSNSVIESASGDNKEIEAGILEKSIEEHAVQNETPFEDMSKKFAGQFSKDKLDTGYGTLKKKRVKKKRKLSHEPSSLNDGALMDIQGTSAKDSYVEVLDQVTTFVNIEELMEEVVSVNDDALLIKENDSNPVNESASGDKKETDFEISEKSIEELAVHNEAPFEDISEKCSRQVDNDKLDTGCGTLKKKKRVKKKKKLSTDPSSLNNKDFPVEVLDSLPTSAYTKELMGEVVSVKDPTLLIEENELPPVCGSSSGDKKEIKTEILEKSIKEHGIRDDATFKDMPEKCSQQLNKDKLHTWCVTMKIEHTSQDATTISSEISESTDDDDVSQPDIGKEGLLPASLGVLPGNLRKKLLILDVNGILTDIVLDVSEEYTPDTFISRKAAFKRPFVDDFLRFCFENFHVGVWSSRTMRNLKSIVDFLMGDLRNNLLFCWDQTLCTDTGFNTLENRDKPMVLKELKKLWEKHEPNLPWKKGDYNESNTLLIDDSPYKALHNPPYTAIFPYPYCYKDVKDNSLGPGGDLRVYLEGLTSADDVQKYVEANPFGQRAITNANASWNFYSKVIRVTSLLTKKR